MPEGCRRCPHCQTLLTVFSFDDHVYFCRIETAKKRIEVVDPVVAEKLRRARQHEREWRHNNRLKKQREEQERIRRDAEEGARLMSVVLAAFTRPEVTEYAVEPAGEDDE